MRDEAAKLAKIIATPSSLATEISKHIFGYKFDPAPHLLYFEREILPELLNFEDQSFLMLNCPPRHGKTDYVRFLAAWFLMMYPTKRVIYISYNDDLSSLTGMAVKTIVEQFGPRFFNVRVPKASPKSDWLLDVTYEEGEGNILAGMLSVGVGSTITGRGGDLIIVDDLIKNAEEAASVATKAKHVREYDATIRSRLEPGGTIVFICTRWAEDDLPGTIQERFESYKNKPEDEQGDPWKFVEFPALAEISEIEMEELASKFDNADDLDAAVEAWRDPLGRASGEALWATRYKAKALRTIKNSISPLEWSALYQQRPTAHSGGMFPKTAWGYFPAKFSINEVERCILLEHELEITAKCWAWDLAFTPEGGDYTVGELWARTADERLALLEFHRIRKAGEEVENLIISCAMRSGNSVPILIEQERAGSGKYVIQSFQKLLPGYIVEGRRPEGTKEERATPWSSFVQAGRAILPEGALFIRNFHHEHRVFPRGHHDDQVDPGVYASNYLMLNAGVVSWSPMTHIMGGRDAEDEMLAWLTEAHIHSSRYIAG